MEQETDQDLAFTAGGFERFDKAVEIYTRAFYTDPGFTWTLNGHTDQRRRAILKPFFNVLIRACLLNGGLVTTLGDWKTVAVMLPPGKRLDNPWTMPAAGLFKLPFVIGFPALWKTLWHADRAMARAKKLYIPKKARYHYLFIIATPEEFRGSGFGTLTLKYLQEQAASQNTHIWLEASSESSMRLYQRCGFVTKEIIHLGVGEADATGEKCPDGEGIRLWAMLWSPPAKTTG